MTLFLSNKFFIPQEQKNFEIAFDHKKNKLKLCSIDKTKGLLNQREEIAKHVNQLSKPIFSDIEQFRNCFKKLQSWNSSCKHPSEQIDLNSFVDQFQPTKKELLERIFAVHATDVLPDQNNELCPFSYVTDVKDENNAVQSNLMSVFHFSLGSLAKSYTQVSFEKRRYAIITPLAAIYDRMINIFVQDTFIRGSFKLSKFSILLVGHKTDVSHLKKDFNIISYDEDKLTLRNAIQRVILAYKGVVFASKATELGDPAFLDAEININTPVFFKSLLDEKKGKLSFGDSTASEIGNAFLFGSLTNYFNEIDNSSQPKNRADQFHLYTAYCLLNICFEKAISLSLLNDEETKKIKNLLECKKIDHSHYEFIADQQFICGTTFGMFSLNELKKIMNNYSALIPKSTNFFMVEWAVQRWLIIGYKQGLEEQLDELINSELSSYFTRYQGVSTKTNIPIMDGIILKTLNKYQKKGIHSQKVVSVIKSLKMMQILNSLTINSKEKLTLINNTSFIIKPTLLSVDEVSKKIDEISKKITDAIAKQSLLKAKEDADDNMNALIEAEEKEKKLKKGKRKQEVKKKNLKEQKIVKKEIQETKKKPIQDQPTLLDHLPQFASELLKSSCRCKELPRIRRWETKNINEIRQFKDKVNNGTASKV